MSRHRPNVGDNNGQSALTGYYVPTHPGVWMEVGTRVRLIRTLPWAEANVIGIIIAVRSGGRMIVRLDDGREIKATKRDLRVLTLAREAKEAQE